MLLCLSIYVTTEGRYGEINLAGISFYNKLIDTLLAKGLFPFLDLKNALAFEYN